MPAIWEQNCQNTCNTCTCVFEPGADSPLIVDRAFRPDDTDYDGIADGDNQGRNSK